MKVDVLYLAHGRLEFTANTLPTLLENTDWSLVNKLVVYHDACTDLGAQTEYIESVLDGMVEPHELRLTNLASPVGVTNHFLHRTGCEVFAKIDSDVIVPPGWLDEMLDVIERHPEVELLGMQAGMGGLSGENFIGLRGVLPATHIGGVGLMRVSAFRNRQKKPVADGRFGFTEWQHEHGPSAAWISPDIATFCLDFLPFEPWLSLTERYVKEGINREWPVYPREMDWYWNWWDTNGGVQ